MFIVSLVAGAIAAAEASTSTNPLALAEDGLLQCYRPDVSKKTCRMIASYIKTGPGTYDNKAIVAVSSEGPVSVETHTPVTVRDGAVCGLVRTQEIRAGTLRIADRVVAAPDAQPVLERVVRVVAAWDGQETCTRYEPTGSDFTAKISIEGTYRPDLDTKIKWISAGDGYSVRP